jgi:hypothetical protein
MRSRVGGGSAASRRSRATSPPGLSSRRRAKTRRDSELSAAWKIDRTRKIVASPASRVACQKLPVEMVLPPPSPLPRGPESPGLEPQHGSVVRLVIESEKVQHSVREEGLDLPRETSPPPTGGA